MSKAVRKILAGVFIFAVAIGLSGCSTCSRAQERRESEYGLGVKRQVVLYSVTGEPVESWVGIIDVQYVTESGGPSRADLLVFDESGNVLKRIIVSPGAGQLVVTSDKQGFESHEG